MRILLITNVFPSPRRPTKGTFNGEMVKGLRAAGDDVRVLIPTPWTDLLRTRAHGPPSEGSSTVTWWYPPRTAHHQHHRWMARTVAPAALALAHDWRPDLVVGYWAHPDGTVAMDVADALGVPGVMLVGGSDIQLLAREVRRRAVIVATLQRAARVLAVGEPLRQATIALGIDATKVGTFSRGVDRSRFVPGDRSAARSAGGLPADRAIVLWVGRMVPVKGLDVLLTAWRNVQDHPHRPVLVLVGDGELRASLERQAAPYGDSVRFVGAQPHAALPDWYRAADVMTLPSRSEGIPNVLLEALACGTPFVASAVGGVSELLHPHCTTVPAGDALALAAALRAAIAAPPMSVTVPTDIPDRSAAIAALRHEFAAVVDGADLLALR